MGEGYVVELIACLITFSLVFRDAVELRYPDNVAVVAERGLYPIAGALTYTHLSFSVDIWAQVSVASEVRRPKHHAAEKARRRVLAGVAQLQGAARICSLRGAKRCWLCTGSSCPESAETRCVQF